MGEVPFLQLQDVSVHRGGQRVLDQLSLGFAPRSITAIVGPSGVGKTSLMGLLNGLLAPSSGQVTLSDLGDVHQPGRLRQHRQRTATIFQDHALIDRLSALDNVLLGLADQRSPWSPGFWPRLLCERAATALDEVGLLALAHRPVARLSGGERQRVGIARALVRQPGLLLGDEPFSSVDPARVARLSLELRHLVQRGGITVILVLHQLDVARHLADRIVGLRGGRVAFDGPAARFDAAASDAIFSPDPSLDLQLPQG